MEPKKIDNFVIATLINDKVDDVLIALRDLPTSKLIIIREKGKNIELGELYKILEVFKISKEERELKNLSLEEVASLLKDLSEIYGEDLLLLVNAAKKSSIVTLVLASIIAKVRILVVDNNSAIILPKYNFQLTSEISDTKKKILELLLKEPNCCSSLNKLSQKLSISLPLISYHLYGTHQNPGLEKLGLVTLVKNKNKITVELTDLGKLVAKGLIQ